MDLFSNDNVLPLDGAEIIYYPDFLNAIEAKHFYDLLIEETAWQQDDIKVFGKTYAQPRLTALYAINKKPYSYSNITMHPSSFTPALTELKSRIEQRAEHSFTTCLLNLYRDGKDSNGWHADNEKELGVNPVIASLSLGAPRVFKLRKREDHKKTYKITLESGSLLLMKGPTQHNWQHQIPKTSRKIEPRINLTFRTVY